MTSGTNIKSSKLSFPFGKMLEMSDPLAALFIPASAETVEVKGWSAYCTPLLLPIGRGSDASSATELPGTLAIPRCRLGFFPDCREGP